MKRKRKIQGGFTLTEVVTSMAILAGVALPLMNVLLIGVEDTRETWNARLLGNLRSAIEQRLQDSSWPAEAEEKTDWTAHCGFGQDGAFLKADDTQVSMKATLRAMPGLGHRSPWLECVQVTFHGADNRLIGQCVLQRPRRPAK